MTTPFIFFVLSAVYCGSMRTMTPAVVSDTRCPGRLNDT
jgi:hypothetical protein